MKQNKDKNSIEEMFNKDFAEDESRLRELIGTSVTFEEYKILCENRLDSFISSLEAEFSGRYEPLKEKLSSVNAKLADLKTEEVKLNEGLRKCVEYKGGKHSSIYYKIMYVTLVVGGITVFTWRFRLIMPEQNPIIGAIQSIVMAAPSFLINYSYEKSQNKDRFLRWLDRIGLTCASLMTLSAAIAGASANFLLSNATASSGSFLTTGYSYSWLDKVQLISSTLCFITAIGVEIIFGGRLLIIINEEKAARRPIEGLKDQLDKTQREISELEPESIKLAEEICRIEAFQNISKSWRISKLQELLLSHKVAQNEAHIKAMKEDSNPQSEDIIRLSNGIDKRKRKKSRES